MTFIPVILSGGSGTRLWPLSSPEKPKQFLSLIQKHNGKLSICLPKNSRPENTCFPNAGLSLFDLTLKRLNLLDQCLNPLIICNQKHLGLAEFSCRQHLNPTLKPYFISEPCGRNTAASIALAALWAIHHQGPDSLLLVMPSDHLITDPAAFVKDISSATALADQGRIALFGIPPTRADVGYGYIRHQGTQVLSFTEKPDAAKATLFLESDHYLWNAGVFCFSAKIMAEEMHKHAPLIWQHTQACFSAAVQQLAPKNPSDKKSGSTNTSEPGSTLTLPDSFQTIPAMPIDKAVMEKTSLTSVVPASFPWEDLGTWESLKRLMPCDENQNTFLGPSDAKNLKNCFVYNAHSTESIRLSDAKNLTVVQTPDALLIRQNASAQTSRSKAWPHAAVKRPWGSYTVLFEERGYKIKRIQVHPGGTLSLQSHQHRSEHWTVITGTATVTKENDVFTLQENQGTFIPATSKHRLANHAATDLVIIEIQKGPYLGEDDIQRFDDVYGRIHNVQKDASRPPTQNASALDPSKKVSS